MAIVALTFLLSLITPPKIFSLGVWCFSGFSGLFPIVLAAVYWRRATKTGAIAAMLVTAVTWCILFWRSGIMQGQAAVDEPLLFTAFFTPTGAHVDGLMPVTVIVGACAVTMIVVSLLTQPPPREVVDRFIPRGDTDPA
jgi:SSS family solute:Na+ symporter